MERREGFKFSDKHKAEEPNDRIKSQIIKRSKKETISCAVAFEIVKDIHVSPAEVGKTLDLMNYRLIKCQLGLFGYQPEKKIVKPHVTNKQGLKDAIRSALADGRLPCKNAWEIAARFQIQKMTVCGICEDMGIKIKPCQLGAF